MSDSKELAPPPDPEAESGEMSEAEIDQNLEDTFPASDPPSWTLGTNHGPESNSEPLNKPRSESDDSEAE